MIQQQDDGPKAETREDGGNVALYPEESRNDLTRGSNKKRTSSNDSSPSSSFENKIGKKYNPQSEFKVHFYVRHVHMNGMNENEFLSFIKRKVNLAGSCEVVQMFNQQGSFCDVAIGMMNDDNAKLVYIGKKHFNFGRNGRQKENVELSDAFRNYLENKKMLDKDHLERSLRRNQQIKGRSESSESSRHYKSRSTSKKKKSKKNDTKQGWQVARRRSPSSSSEPRKVKKPKKTRHSSQSSSRESNKESLNVQPIKPQQVFTDKNTVFIFSIPQEVNEQDVIAEIVNAHKQIPPLSHNWNTSEKMQYLELQFQDENTAQFLVNLRPCLHVKGIPLLVVAKKQRPVQELLRNFEVQVELDRDVPAFNVYLEFKKYGDLIGIYVFQQNRNYLLLYSSSSQLQEALRPPVHLQLNINDQMVNANAKIIEKPIDIQRPLIKETLAYQLNNQTDKDDDDDSNAIYKFIRQEKKKIKKSRKTFEEMRKPLKQYIQQYPFILQWKIIYTLYFFSPFEFIYLIIYLREMNTQNPDGQFESVRDIDTDLLTQQPNHLPTKTSLPPPQKPINPELKGNILREMSIKRKSEGYQQFKNQEEFIMTSCQQHLVCSDTVIEQLDMRVLLSERSLHAVIFFLKERLAQEQNNVKLLTQKNPSFLQIYKDQDSSIYPKFSASLEHLNQLHQAQGKSLSILIANMEKMIKEKFEANINAYTGCINQVVSRIKQRRKAAREHQIQINDRSKKVQKLYNEMMSNGGNHKKRSKDLFNQERKFTQIVYTEVQLLSQLGEDIISYYNEVIKQESIRLEIISAGIRYYLEKFHETYSGTTPSAQVQLVLQKFKDYNSIEESSQIIIKDVGFIKDIVKCDEIGFPQLKTYLIQFPQSLVKKTLPQVNPFILKYFPKLQRDVGSLLTKWQNCIAVVSIDRHLLLYDSEDSTLPNTKAAFKFAIEHTQLILKPKQQLIADLKHVVPGLVFDSKESIALKFSSQDDFDEMHFYLSNQ